MAEFGKQLQHIRGIDAAPDLKEIFDTLSQIYEACSVYGTTAPGRCRARTERADHHDRGVEQVNLPVRQEDVEEPLG